MNTSTKKSIKECNDNQERNLKTKRCRKKCNDNQERNLKTDKCRKKCNDDQERNYETDRCNYKSLKIKFSSPKIKSPKKQSPKIKSPKRQLEETNFFIDLCKEFIMTDKLDHVVATTWLNNNDCNIFLIGEEHYPHNNSKCIGILDMFRNLLEKNTKNKANIDLFIEIYNDYVLNSHKYDFNYDSNKIQISNIRTAFMNCIKSKKCSYVRVHWSDPTIMSEKHKRYNEFPYWLQILQKYNNSTSENFIKWKTDEIILKHFNPYVNENDILKLLTENAIVMKEIRRASRINPNFEIEKIKSIFLEIYYILKKENRPDYLIFTMDRSVMDFYTIARIIKLNLKNVIIYAGNNHTQRIIFILKYFGFFIKEQILGNCM